MNQTSLFQLIVGQRYAVNLADLTKYAPRDGGLALDPINLLLLPVLNRHETVLTEGNKWDGVAVRVQDNIPQERWDAIYQIIRAGAGRHAPIPKYALRIYESRTGTGGWKRI